MRGCFIYHLFCQLLCCVNKWKILEQISGVEYNSNIRKLEKKKCFIFIHMFSPIPKSFFSSSISDLPACGNKMLYFFDMSVHGQ